MVYSALSEICDGFSALIFPSHFTAQKMGDLQRKNLNRSASIEVLMLYLR